MTTKSPSKAKARGARKKPVLLKAVLRSKLEDRIDAQITAAGVPFTYEKLKVSYEVPARKAKYTPDFHLNDTIVVEAKGYFRQPADRQKLALVKEQHPDLDLRLVFQKAHLPIYKGSKTTYADWADSHGFLWADGGVVPEAWLIEAMKKAKT